MSTLTEKDISSALRGEAEALEAQLELIEKGASLTGCAVKVSCHCLKVDANGKVQPARLAQFMRNAVIDYAIPRSTLAAAKARDVKYNTTESVTALFERAKRSFTDLEKTGEGGEMLLFLLAERFLKLPQILCKMDLKTSPQMHYHGADGVHAGLTPEGTLKLYWSESKVYQDASTAIRDCLASLGPYLIEPDAEDSKRARDLTLLSDNADLNDEAVNGALRQYFDSQSLSSMRVQYCGLALVGFDASFYPTATAKTWDTDLGKACIDELKSWKAQIRNRLVEEKLDQIEIVFLCIPLPSVADFRAAFLKAMGLEDK